MNSSRNKVQQTLFINTFEIIIKNLIIPYFIASNQYSNNSNELCNLMICSHYIQKVFKQNFKLRYMYNINNITDLNKLALVKNITFGGAFNQPLKQDALPRSLTSLIFGDGFNQPLEQDTLPGSLTSLMIKKRPNQKFDKCTFKIIYI